MQSNRNISELLDQGIQSAAAMCVLLALLAVVFGPTEMTSAGMQLRMVYAGYCMLACVALCGITLARFFSRRRALVKLVELRYSTYSA